VRFIPSDIRGGDRVKRIRSVVLEGTVAVAIVAALSACEGGASTADTLARITQSSQTSSMTVFVASNPQFNGPAGIAVDGSGTVYVADYGNSTVRMIMSGNAVSTLAGTAGVQGSADGTGAAAQFNWPLGAGVDNAGNVFVADGNNTIRRITSAGVVSTFAGTAGVTGSADGTGAAAQFNQPSGVAVDGAGNVYVAELGNDTIRKITPAGVVSTLAGTAGVEGSADGTGASAQFTHPWGVAVDGSGYIYVADTDNNTIRKIAPDGVVSTLGGTAGVSGSADGTGAAAQFSSPQSVAVDESGYVYVADSNNNTIRKITPEGLVTTLAGIAGVWGSADGTGAAAQFSYPWYLAVDRSGNVYVSDEGNATIRTITPAGVVSTAAGTVALTGSADGTIAASHLAWPYGVAMDGLLNVYVADHGNNTIRKITPAGAVSTLAGTAGVAGSADGTGAAARFNQPSGIAVDGAGNVYVGDYGNNTIRKITSAGVVSTVAGAAGVFGSADGAGAQARFAYPNGVAVDGSGNVYVADQGNCTIRKITPAGVVSTLAGTAGVWGSSDGTGSAAQFGAPAGVTVDKKANVYVADWQNDTIRKITAAGVVSTVAGTAGVQGSADGTGAAARFNYPWSVAVDGSGILYVADRGNSTIRKIGSSGAVSTVVGVAGHTSNVPGPLPASIAPPYGVAADPTTTGTIMITNMNGAMKVLF